MAFAAVVGKVRLDRLLDGGVFPICDVVTMNSLGCLKAEDSVLVIGRKPQLSGGEISAFSVVVNADEQFGREALCGQSVISCGMSGRNTVSVTSKTVDSITLSLNRAITTMKGLCEPLELPVKRVGGCSDYDYMAAFAVSLLLGNTGS